MIDLNRSGCRVHGLLPLPSRTRVYPSSALLAGRSRKHPTSTGERVGVRGTMTLAFVTPHPPAFANASAGDLSHRTRVYPRSALNAVEVGNIRLRLER